MPDPYIKRMWADMTTWLALERTMCKCDDVCACGWDDIKEAHRQEVIVPMERRFFFGVDNGC